MTLLAGSAAASWSAPTEIELRPVLPGTAEYRRWIDLAADAYPITRLVTPVQRNAAFEEQRDLAEREPEHRLVGAFVDGTLVGGMRLYDFWMNIRGATVFSGGLGSLAVGLEWKRRGIGRALVGAYLEEYRERGAALGVLYPFRPDFYSKLGFGYGAKVSQYRIALAALPDDRSRERVRRLGPHDVDAFQAIYAHVQERTNGLIRRERWRAAARLGNAATQTFGYERAGRLCGYIVVEVRLGDPATTNRNELYALELVYADPAALNGLLSFVGSQRDQFVALTVNTADPDFHFAVADARNGSDRNLLAPVVHETNAQGIGVMYRVLAVPALVDALRRDGRFGQLDAVVRVDLSDAGIVANAGSCALRLRAGALELVDAGTPADVDIVIDVGDFSALVMGSVRLRSLVAYGRAIISDTAWLDRLDAALVADPPQCLTRF
jgi:predicted acetyltransferase